MGSPVSAVIAELVMAYIETEALTTFSSKPRWWRRYVDDSNACLKQVEVDSFHKHLNSINPHIQFTIEHSTVNGDKQSIAFLDCQISAQPGTNIKVSVYRKQTHTNKYLDFKSHNPKQHKEAVVKTLMHRAREVPTDKNLQQEERIKVSKDLEANGYPRTFIQKAERPNIRCAEPEDCPSGTAVIPYVKGIGEQLKRVLRRAKIRTIFKPSLTLSNIFKKPKDRPEEFKVPGIVYKVKCKDCCFTYVGESKRSWDARGKEHNPGRRTNNESAIKQHAETTEHDIHPKYVTILERGITDYAKRMFLESWHSTLDKNAINERKEFPTNYIPLLKSHRDING